MRRFGSLQRRADFTRLRQRGRRTAAQHLAFHFETGRITGERPLVGITVSKLVGNAVVRNRVRRRIAAALEQEIAPGARFRLVVVARPSSAEAPYASLRDEIRQAFAR